jgi:hypothetical protein
VFCIENSHWLRERFAYEKEHYEGSYEGGGDVNEMLTDFKHYLFEFHDEFIEVIAKGFWFEEDDDDLFGKELTVGHPLLPLTTEKMEKFECNHITVQIRMNKAETAELVHNAQYCSQKLYDFILELDGKELRCNTLYLWSRNGEIISILRGYFGKPVEFPGIATLEQVMPHIKKYTREVYERRQKS